MHVNKKLMFIINFFFDIRDRKNFPILSRAIVTFPLFCDIVDFSSQILRIKELTAFHR